LVCGPNAFSTSKAFIVRVASLNAQVIQLGILDSIRRKKNAPVDNDPDRHHVEALDYFKEIEKEDSLHCPECAKARKHVRLVRTEGETMECPECHYLHEIRRA